MYQQNHHMALAQSRTMALCHELLPDAKIGPAPNIVSVYPETCSPDDVIAADDHDAVRNLLYLDLAVRGTYHPVAWAYLVEKGYEPTILDGDLDILASGNPDFLGFNYYSTQTVAAPRGDGTDVATRPGDQQVVTGEEGVYLFGHKPTSAAELVRLDHRPRGPAHDRPSAVGPLPAAAHHHRERPGRHR